MRLRLPMMGHDLGPGGRFSLRRRPARALRKTITSMMVEYITHGGSSIGGCQQTAEQSMGGREEEVVIAVEDGCKVIYRGESHGILFDICHYITMCACFFFVISSSVVQRPPSLFYPSLSVVAVDWKLTRRLLFNAWTQSLIRLEITEIALKKSRSPNVVSDLRGNWL